MKDSKKDHYFIHESSYVDEDYDIGEGTKIWHFSHIMNNSKIGMKCNIGQNVFIGSNVVIGNNVKIQNNVSVYSGVVCEDEVFLGPSMVFLNVKNPRSSVIRKDKFISTIVKKGATIGANATIICGVSIGKFSFIGAGSVITKDVKDYALVFGNPGIQHGWVSEFGNKLNFNSDGIAFCVESNQNYMLKNNIVTRLNDKKR